MKTLIRFVVVALLGAVGPVAAAPSAALSVAYWNTSAAESAFGLGVKGRFSWLEIRAAYFGDFQADNALAGRDFQLSLFPLEAGFAVNVPVAGAVVPYVGGGPGFYFMDSSLGQVDNRLGWYAVIGGEYNAGETTALLLEAVYRHLDTTVAFHQVTTGLQQQADLALSGPGINAALVLRF